MTYVEKMLEDPIVMLLSFILILYAIKELMGLASYYKASVLDKYRKKENEKEDVTEQITNIACVSKEHTDALHQLKDSIIDIKNDIKDLRTDMNDKFDKADEARKADTRAMARSELYDLYEKFKDKDSLTLRDHETFMELADIYHSCNGNSTMSKVIEIVDAMPLKEN